MKLIGELISGAFTGYITNTLAVNMIFKDYGIGKFKVGGVIVKTRDAFIDNVSSLVERDIINYNTLEGELRKDSFEDSLRSFVVDFLKVHLYTNTSNLCFREIDGFDETVENVQRYIKHSIDEYGPNILSTVCKNININELVGNQQFKYISEKMFDCIVDIIKRDEFIENTVRDFYMENKSLKIEEFFNEKIADVWIKNIKDNIHNFHEGLKDQFDEEINGQIKETYRLLDINKVLKTLENQVKEKKLIEFVSGQDHVELWNKLKETIHMLIQSEETKKVIENLSKIVLDYLKEQDQSVIEFFNTDMDIHLVEFLEDKVPMALNRITKWIEENKEDIETLLEDTIDDSIKKYDESEQMVLSLVREFLLDNFIKKNQVVPKVTEYVENNVDENYVSMKISIKMMEYAKNKKIAHIMYLLEENQIFNHEILSRWITKNIGDYIDNRGADYLQNILNKKLKDVLNVDLVNTFETYINEPLKDFIKQNILYHEKSTKYMGNEIEKGIKNTIQSSIEELVKMEDLKNNIGSIKEEVVKRVKNNKKEIIDKVYEEIQKLLDGKNLYEYIDDAHKERLVDTIGDKVQNRVSLKIQKYGNEEVSILYDKINKVENVDKIITEKIGGLLRKNLKNLLEGNIKNIVAHNLHNLKDEDLKVVAKNFMGKELRPISYFGAGLGAIAGILLYFLNTSFLSKYSINIQGAEFEFVNILVYALVGWLTNVVALKMIFKPYHQKKILGIKVPFTPGYLPSNKPRFAKSLGKFIDGELLNKKDIERILNKNRRVIFDKFKDTISKDHYEMVTEYIYRYIHDRKDDSCVYIYKYLEENKDQITNIVMDEIEHLDMKNIDISRIQRGSKKAILDEIKGINKNIFSEIKDTLNADEEILDVIPKFMIDGIERKMAKKIGERIESISKYLEKEENIMKTLGKFSNRYEHLIDKPICEILDENTIQKLKNNISDYIQNKTASQEAMDLISSGIEKIVLSAVSSDEKIGEVWDGTFKKMVKKNEALIFDEVANGIHSGAEKIQEKIEKSVITAVQSKLNFLQQLAYGAMGGDDKIKGVVDTLIKDKLPDFIESKKEGLTNLIIEFLTEDLFSSKVSDLQMSPNKSEVTNIISNFFNKKNQSEINEVLNVGAYSMCDRALGQKASVYLVSMGEKNLEDVLNTFRKEINLVALEIKNQLDMNKERINCGYSKLLSEVFNKLVLKNKINTISKGVTLPQIEEISEKIGTFLWESSALDKNIDEWVKVFENNIKSKKIYELIDVDEFNKSINNIVVKLANHEEMKVQIKDVVEDLLRMDKLNEFEIIESSTKDCIADRIINAIIDSGEHNLEKILKTVDFKGITKREINQMHPKDIDDLFHSFGKDYFNQLELYGFGGGIFGIHSVISTIAVIVYGIANMSHRKKD